MKEQLKEIWAGLIATLIMTALIIGLVVTMWGLGTVIRDSFQSIAWCSSQGGSWGFGACYIDGVEVQRWEENE